LDVDKDTAELLKNLGFAKLPINVTHVSAQSQERRFRKRN
jgi:small subunit ribosomal protein S17e